MDGSIRASGPGPKGRRRHQRSANACVPHAPSNRPRHDLGGTDLDRIGRARRPCRSRCRRSCRRRSLRVRDARLGQSRRGRQSRRGLPVSWLASRSVATTPIVVFSPGSSSLLGSPCGQRGDPFVTLVVPDPADAVGDDHRGDGRLADAGARDSDAARGALGGVARLGDRRARAGTNAADRPSRSHPERTSREGPLSPQGSTSPGTTSHPAGRAKP